VKILGVHVGHDSSAALLVDGRVLADVAEERFSRIKHYAGLPVRSIQYCLEHAGLEIGDLDAVAIPTRGQLRALNHLFDLEGDPREQGRQDTRAEELARRTRLSRSMRFARMPLYATRFPLGKDTDLVHVEHHLAHAASAYYTSGSDERQLIATMDGAGDGNSVALWRGENGVISPLRKLGTEASLGWFYSNVTEALGWWHGDGEGKTMGLAAYGDPDPAREMLEPFHPKFSGGELVESHDFGAISTWNETGAQHWHLDEAAEIAALIPRVGREGLAAAAQAVLEDQVCEIVYPWLERERTRNLSCSGGVFLNVKLNQRIWSSGRVDRHHIYPNPGDGGLAVGAALQVHHSANAGAQIHGLAHLYLGPEYGDEAIAKILADRGLESERRDDVVDVVAGLLAENKIVAWFQGRMESGPRALGGRSILMSPTRPKNKDVINARVKYREPFRPFCPSISAEHAADYLVGGRQEAFMITSFDGTAAGKPRIPAAVHVDGTVRPQTVERGVNQDYWEVIERFGQLTGEHALLNTSFNIKGEPMICHPREAIRAFYDTGLDYLVLGQHIVGKNRVPAAL
jgi:carbamoyltransferase